MPDRSTRAGLGILVAILLGSVPRGAAAQSPSPGGARAAAAAPAAPSTPSPGADAVPTVVPGELVVVGRTDGPGGRGRTGPLSFGSTPPEAVRDLARRAGVPSRAARPVALGPAAARAYPGGAWILTLEPDQDPDRAAAALARDPDVRYAGPNHVVAATGDGPTDDPLSEDQWALFSARVIEAWQRTFGAGVLVAVIDTGVELDHPDLAGALAVNVLEQNGLPGVDDDKNGYVDDVWGYDFTDASGLPGAGDYLERDPDPTDDVGHGTQVAGVIVAVHNTIGVAGIAPDARVLAVRAGFRTTIPLQPGLLEEDDIAAAMLYAVDRGAQILNLSFGIGTRVPLLADAVDYARAHGVLVVASAGNSGQDEAFYPGSYPGVLSVGASARTEERAAFSTFGQDVDFLAPGLGIYTTDLGGRYRSSSGTSLSAPVTCGAAALLWSVHPDWSADEVAWRLRLSCRRPGAGWNAATGWGLLDVEAALGDSSRPPVAQVEGAEPRPEGVQCTGTVVDPALTGWTLTAVPESVAVAAGTGALTGEIVLARDDTRQLRDESLGPFALPASEPAWVLRLVTRVRGLPVIEERSRYVPPSLTMSVLDPAWETQVGAAGWNLAVWWRSPETYQGAVILGGPAGDARVQSERSLSHRHAIRAAGPLPEGDLSLRLLGRVVAWAPYIPLIDAGPVPVPAAVTRLTPGPVAAVLAGTPMRHPVDWDGDGLPEVLVEAAPTSDVYGNVVQFELQGGMPVEIASSQLVYRGIPVDAADADADGRQELAVYRLDGWSVREAQDPGGFPTVSVLGPVTDGSVPLAYVPGGPGAVLLAVLGDRLQAWVPSGGGYVLASEAVSGSGSPLRNRVQAADLDGDGVTDVWIADEAGALVRFELDGTTLRWRESLTPPRPLAGPLRLVPAAGGGLDLVTAEMDPASLEEEGDLDRAALRLRRWRMEAGALVPGAGTPLAFAGFRAAGELQLLPWGDDLLLRRGDRLDVVLNETSGLHWGGEAFRSGLAGVDGSVLLDGPDPQSPFLWLGSAGFQAGPGELVPLAGTSSRHGGRIRTLATRAVAGGAIEVVLGWDGDGCDGSVTLQRSGDRRGSYVVPVTGRSAVDTLDTGEVTHYDLLAPPCAARTLTLPGVDPPVPAPYWDGAGRIVVDLDVPLERDAFGSVIPPREVLQVTGSEVRAPDTWQVVSEGARLVLRPGLRPGESDPESVVVVGAWREDGHPVGGAVRGAFRVPARPVAGAPPVLAAVRYATAAAELSVEIGGGAASCPARLVLDPGNRDLGPAPGPGSSTVPLAGSLAAGDYTLRLTGDCLDPADRALAREFHVGIVLFPNPVRPGQDLVLQNVTLGSRIQVRDVAGSERLSWTTAAVLERHSVDALAPGLYVLRVEAPDGRTTGVLKFAVVR